MRKELRDILFSVFWGIVGYTIAFVILESLYYLVSDLPGLLLPKAIFQSYAFQIISFQLNFAYLLQFLGNGLVEEIVRFSIIKRWKIINPYGLILGLIWGITENIYRSHEGINGRPLLGISILLHITNAGIICYFVRNNRPKLGLTIALLLHTGWNLLGIFA